MAKAVFANYMKTVFNFMHIYHHVCVCVCRKRRVNAPDIGLLFILYTHIYVCKYYFLVIIAIYGIFSGNNR